MARGVAGPEKLLCGAALPGKRKGTYCKNVAGKKTSHLGAGRCYKHGGSTDTQVQKASLELATREAHALSVPIQTNPFDAINMALAIVAGEVSYYTGKIEALDPDAVFVRPVSKLWRPLDMGKEGEDPNVRVEETTEGPLDLNIYIKARNQAVDRWVHISKTAIQANIAERLAKMDEDIGASISAVLAAILPALGVPNNAKTAAIVQKEMAALDAAASKC